MAAPAVDVVVPGLDVGAEEITEQQSQNVNEAHYSGDGSPRAVSASGATCSAMLNQPVGCGIFQGDGDMNYHHNYQHSVVGRKELHEPQAQQSWPLPVQCHDRSQQHDIMQDPFFYSDSEAATSASLSGGFGCAHRSLYKKTDEQTQMNGGQHSSGSPGYHGHSLAYRCPSPPFRQDFEVPQEQEHLLHEKHNSAHPLQLHDEDVLSTAADQAQRNGDGQELQHQHWGGDAGVRALDQESESGFSGSGTHLHLQQEHQDVVETETQCPCRIGSPPGLGEELPGRSQPRPHQLGHSSRTQTVSLSRGVVGAGASSATSKLVLDENGLPPGWQVVGRRGDEITCVRGPDGAVYNAACPWGWQRKTVIHEGTCRRSGSSGKPTKRTAMMDEYGNVYESLMDILQAIRRYEIQHGIAHPVKDEDFGTRGGEEAAATRTSIASCAEFQRALSTKSLAGKSGPAFPTKDSGENAAAVRKKTRAAEVLQKLFSDAEVIPADADEETTTREPPPKTNAVLSSLGLGAGPLARTTSSASAGRLKRTISNFKDKDSGAPQPPPVYGESTKRIWRQRNDKLSEFYSNDRKHVLAVQTLERWRRDCVGPEVDGEAAAPAGGAY